jgi:hypothetical protein
VANTGNWDTFVNVNGTLANVPTGTTQLFLVFKGVTGQGNIFDLDAFTLNPGTSGTSRTVEGESWSSTGGVQSAAHAGASGGATAGFIETGDWAGYSQVNTSGAKGFSARISSAGAGGTITIRSGSQTGTVLGTVTVPVTGGWETFQDITTTLTGNVSGPLFLSFTGGAGSLFDVDTVTVRF